MVMTPTNTKYSPDRMSEAFESFRGRYPDFESTRHLDDLRASDYGRLDRENHVYLDYTGGGLYAESQLHKHMALLTGNVYGNPHSTNLTSMAMTRLVESARDYVLEFFNASPDEYVVIFTQNATGALKLVGESYPFDANSNYLLTYDNHNSVNGIREFAHARGATVTYIPLVPPDLRMDEAKLEQGLKLVSSTGHHLFAYPAQSNFSGVYHPLEWIEKAQSMGWDVLVDAAAFAPTSRLDLSKWHPDFVDLSFYKLFGYPTGVGCLLARKNTVHKLHRPWYAGGTITFSSVQAEGFYLTPGAAGFEDGTVNYLSLPAIEIGLRHIASIGMDTIHTRVMALSGWLIDELMALRHSNGQPLIRIYGPADTIMRGATVEVNFFDPNGNLFADSRVEKMANESNISLRAGCHCNPGAREISIGYTEDDMEACFKDKERMTYEQFIHVIDGKTTGAVRASLGLVTNFADVYRYLAFAETFVDQYVQ